MFTVRLRVIPGSDNGAINVNPRHSDPAWLGKWRRLVPAGTPLGGGCSDTGWYSVEERSFDSRLDTALAFGGAIWDCEDPESEGLALLESMGY